MATLPQIRERILAKYLALPTQKEKLEFLYQVQERLRNVHNDKGQQLTDGLITEAQWEQFKSQWRAVSEKVAERIAILRDKVFTEDYGLVIPTAENAVDNDLWVSKKQELKTSLAYKNNIDTIWL